MPIISQNLVKFLIRPHQNLTHDNFFGDKFDDAKLAHTHKILLLSLNSDINVYKCEDVDNSKRRNFELKKLKD